MNQDEEHLRLLSIFHYIVGGITALCACFPLIHFAVGLFLVFGPENTSGPGHSNGMDRLMGLIFTVFAAAIIVLGWGLAIATVYAGRCLARRRKHTFCLGVAAVSCMNAPIGTALGVFTIIVLMRPSVKELFTANQRASSDNGEKMPPSA